MENKELLHLGANLAVACFIGLAIGLERSITKRGMERRLGIRDFILVAIMAFISSMLQVKSPLIWPVAFAGVLGFSLVITYFENMKSSPGLSSALSLPITFLMAGLGNLEVDLWFVATLLFVMLLILGMKEQFHTFSENMNRAELIDLAILIAITITITPLIPKDAALPVPLFSYIDGHWSTTFHKINVLIFWKVVIMVSLMSFGSHFITKYIKGRNALLLATFFGGLVSSLATIILLLRKDPSGERKELSPREVFLGFVAANTGSITKDMVVFFAVIGSATFEKYLFPMASTLVLFASITMYSFAHAESEEIKITDRPLPLSFVTKFSFVFACVMVFMAMVTHYLGSDATVIASFLSGIISSAAALAAVGNSLISNDISLQVGGWSVIAALLGSIFAKYIVIAKRVGWNHSYPFAIPVAALAGVGSLTLWTTLSTLH
ncbi:hypothetical protein SIID45300_01290 [Candidatus Magnetaquicoccaceae bacterium FCR-1]|uniref:DUF4010 domain-containing protein n=1 Tax=Candidatus Magnetaquiglobus chichijimensis TaxID=3141448 RepID=A0ABQ0C7W5_9PROT